VDITSREIFNEHQEKVIKVFYRKCDLETTVTKFIMTVCTFGLIFLGGCTGEDKDSGTTDSAVAAE
jgi:hypothetical protein